MQITEVLSFTDVLRASGRSPEIPEAADAYGWLVGSWELDCRRYAGETGVHSGRRAFRMGSGRAGYPGYLDYAEPVGKRLGDGPNEEHVWNHTARVGFFDPGVENQLAESRS